MRRSTIIAGTLNSANSRVTFDLNGGNGGQCFRVFLTGEAINIRRRWRGVPVPVGNARSYHQDDLNNPVYSRVDASLCRR